MKEVELERMIRGEGNPSELTFRPLKTRDTLLLRPIFKKHGAKLRDFLADYEFAEDWDFKTAASFINSSWSAPHPNYTYVFLQNEKDVVGLASIAPVDDSFMDVQLIYWVNPDFQGQGFGSRMAYTMRWVSLDLWGFNSFNYIVAEENGSSIAVAERLGLELWHKWSGGETHARKETGNWRQYGQRRNPETQKGIMQGAQRLEYWTGGAANSSTLDAILLAYNENEEKGQRLAQEEIDRIAGVEETIDERNRFKKALDVRNAAIARLNQEISSRVGRVLYNKDLQLRRKKKKKKKKK